jgi:hypothetical protein
MNLMLLVSKLIKKNGLPNLNDFFTPNPVRNLSIFLYVKSANNSHRMFRCRYFTRSSLFVDGCYLNCYQDCSACLFLCFSGAVVNLVLSIT